MARLTMLKPRLQSLDLTTAKPPPKQAEQFYKTPEWRALMARLIAARGKRCQDCGRTNTRIFGDHITELKDGGPALEESNVRLLCGSCHTLKTNKARAERMRA